MIHHRIMEEEGILLVEPVASLSKEDFMGLTEPVDAYLEGHGSLHGILIHAERFPGWDSFAGLSAHLKFVRDHHKRIERIAFVTDSPLGAIAETIASHFTTAEIRHFPYSGYEEALNWLKGL